jgi:8-oxo-dGTP diphosphatase
VRVPGALGPDLPVPVAGTDARAARWVPVREALDGGGQLAFDPAAVRSSDITEPGKHPQSAN